MVFAYLCVPLQSSTEQNVLFCLFERRYTPLAKTEKKAAAFWERDTVFLSIQAPWK